MDKMTISCMWGKGKPDRFIFYLFIYYSIYLFIIYLYANKQVQQITIQMFQYKCNDINENITVMK